MVEATEGAAGVVSSVYKKTIGGCISLDTLSSATPVKAMSEFFFSWKDVLKDDLGHSGEAPKFLVGKICMNGDGE